MRSVFFLLALASCLTSAAQPGYIKFNWEPKPVLHKVDSEFESEGAVYVTDKRINEYVIEKDGFFLYRTIHRIVHINNDKGIESFNKIYLPFNEGSELMDVKARTILPNGKIMEMDRKNIKDLKDEDGEFKIFALEGLTKGCEVEYYYTFKQYPSYFGREIMSSRVAAMKSAFELIMPEHLVFETRSYNGLPAAVEKVANEKRHLVITDEKNSAAEEEKYSMYQASLKRVEFKLSYNKAKSENERLFTWNELAKKIFSIYTEINDKEAKRVKSLLNDIGAKGTEVEKIMAIENYLKKNIITRDDIPDDDADDLVKVIKDKVASHKATSKLYVALLTAADVKFQIVLSGDRSDYTVEKNFENWNNTQHFLIYFPTTKKFLAPTEMEYRYPWFPPSWGATNGLFCVTTTIGNFTTAVADIRTIAMEDVKHSFSNMDMALKLENEDALIVNVKQSYGGYTASNYRFPFVYLPADEQHKLLKEMVKFGTNSENILSHSLENREMEQADPYKPFVINATVKSPNLVERAGDKLIIKVGEVIGQQAEMYETKPRSTLIDVSFPHLLERTITLAIPEGYKVKNLEDLKINEVVKENDKITMGFVSSYVLENNNLKITIVETYNNVTYPKDQYEAFKKVINAAADFNKIVLVLDKI